MAAAHQAQLVAARAYEADHVDGIAEAVEWRVKARLARPIAANGDHVLDAARLDQLVVRRELLAPGLDARDVRRCLDAERPDARPSLHRRLARLGTRPRHRDESRPQRFERLDRPHAVSCALAGL